MNAFVSPPEFLKSIFSGIIWNNPNNKVMLTFDDGPDPDATLKILEVLNKHSIKSLFFLTGFSAKDNGKIIEQIVREGHFIANHSWSHSRYLWLKSAEYLSKEITETEKILMPFQNRLEFFRPPFGRFTPGFVKIVKNNNLRLMMYSLMTFDFRNDLNIVNLNLNKYIRSNSIVVFHNNLKTRKNIDKFLDSGIRLITQKGFTFERTFNF